MFCEYKIQTNDPYNLICYIQILQMTTALHQYTELNDRYIRMSELGEGAFGKVYLAQKHPHLMDKSKVVSNENFNQNNFSASQYGQNNQNINKSTPQTRFYAVKKLKPYIRKKQSPINTTKIENYPEIEVMRSLEHPNIMSILEIVQENKVYEQAHYLVLDLGVPLMEFARHKQISLSFEQIRYIISQMVEGLHYIHQQGFMHRDIKPSNIYLTATGTVKIGDFSISRKMSAHPNAGSMQSQEEEQKTGNVTTRNYRAPQIIYGSRHYDQSIDIWGLGCTMAELLLHQPIFPGNTDINQLQLIFSVMGCPQDKWPQAQNLPYYLQFDNSKQPVGLANLLPNIPPILLDFISMTLTLDPKKRPTTEDLRNHPLLKEISKSAKIEFSKICDYLHQKCLKNWFAKVK